MDAARHVMERYDSLSIGLADASNVVVLANGHCRLDVLTLDERHFRVLSDPVDRPFRPLPAHAH